MVLVGLMYLRSVLPYIVDLRLSMDEVPVLRLIYDISSHLQLVVLLCQSKRLVYDLVQKYLPIDL